MKSMLLNGMAAQELAEADKIKIVTAAEEAEKIAHVGRDCRATEVIVDGLAVHSIAELKDTTWIYQKNRLCRFF